MSLIVRNNNLFKTNAWWPFNFEHTDCLAMLLAQPVHIQFLTMGVFKVQGIRNQTSRLKELKTEIWRYTVTVPKTTLAEVYVNYLLRLRTCKENEGGHLHDVIFEATKLSK